MTYQLHIWQAFPDTYASAISVEEENGREERADLNVDFTNVFYLTYKWGCRMPIGEAVFWRPSYKFHEPFVLENMRCTFCGDVNFFHLDICYCRSFSCIRHSMVRSVLACHARRNIALNRHMKSKSVCFIMLLPRELLRDIVTYVLVDAAGTASGSTKKGDTGDNRVLCRDCTNPLISRPIYSRKFTPQQCAECMHSVLDCYKKRCPECNYVFCSKMCKRTHVRIQHRRKYYPHSAEKKSCIGTSIKRRSYQCKNVTKLSNKQLLIKYH